jgi:proline iminopeptidase
VAPYATWEPYRSAFKDLMVRVFEKSGHTPQFEESDLFDSELMNWLLPR